MTIDELRIQINQIDEELLELFKSRMAVSKQIGDAKKEAGLPVFDESREKAVYDRLRKRLNDESFWPYYKAFIKEIMRLSKEIQK